MQTDVWTYGRKTTYMIIFRGKRGREWRGARKMELSRRRDPGEVGKQACRPGRVLLAMLTVALASPARSLKVECAPALLVTFHVLDILSIELTAISTGTSRNNCYLVVCNSLSTLLSQGPYTFSNFKLHISASCHLGSTLVTSCLIR